MRQLVTRTNIWTANFVIHVLRMQHVTARILHVMQAGLPTAQFVRNAALQIRHVPVLMITVVCLVSMTKTVNATCVLITRPVPAGMSIFIANQGIINSRITMLPNNACHVQIMYAMVKHLSVVARGIIYIIRNGVHLVLPVNIVQPERQLLYVKKAIIDQPLEVVWLAQWDIIAHIIPRQPICINIAHLDTIAQAAVAANAPMTLCALVEKWMK